MTRPRNSLASEASNTTPIGTRLRTCCECEKKEFVRSDNAARRCRLCACRAAGLKGRVSRYANYSPKIRSCVHCGTVFWVGPAEPKRHCSRACYLATRRINRECHQCSKPFVVPISRISGKTNASANFCSRSCYNDFLWSGRGAPNRGRSWYAARAEALRRNPFCAVCGTFKYLHVHHIIPYRVSRDNSQENLIPLCRKHHKQVENIDLRSERIALSIPGALFVRRLGLIELQTVTRMLLRNTIREIYGQAA